MIQQVMEAAGLTPTTGPDVWVGGPYTLRANEWGAGNWPRQTRLYTRPDGVTTGPLFGWTADYREVPTGGVKGYPCVEFGQKPGLQNSSTPLLPRRFADLQRLTVRSDFRAEGDGAYNVALDLWLCKGDRVTEIGIVGEVMVWQFAQDMTPAGREVEPGLWLGEGGGWRGGPERWPIYTVVLPANQTQTVNVLDILRRLAANGVEFQFLVANVGWGTEVLSGKVAFAADAYEVIVE